LQAGLNGGGTHRSPPTSNENEAELKGVKNQIAKLLLVCRERGISEITLDELVHETSSHAVMAGVNATANPRKQEAVLDEGSRKGSSVNNAGMESQIQFLLEQRGFDATLQAIQEVEVEG
jgi:hypothetical protein